MSMFSEKRSFAKRAYLDFMQEEEPEEINAFYAKKNLPSVLGDDAFKDWIRQKFRDLRFKQEIPESKQLAPGSNKIRELVCKVFNVESDALMVSKRGTENLARDAAIYLQRKYCGQTPFGIGKGL